MAELDAAHRQVERAHARFLRALAALDAGTEDWQTEGAMDAEHYLGLRFGISCYRAERYLAAARALRGLPHLAAALEEGLLHLEAVLKLARYATPEDEQELIDWAWRVPVGEIRRRGELLHAAARASEVQEDRALEWRFRGEVFELWGRLPSADGALVASAIEQAADRVPQLPGEEHLSSARYADALVQLCSGERAVPTVLVHVPAQALSSGTGGGELERAGVIPAQTAARLPCSGRLQVALEAASGEVVSASPLRRDPPAWMVRQLRWRDRTPGCGARRFTQAHHLTWFSKGGRTELANLVLVRSFHHRLV